MKKYRLKDGVTVEELRGFDILPPDSQRLKMGSFNGELDEDGLIVTDCGFFLKAHWVEEVPAADDELVDELAEALRECDDVLIASGVNGAAQASAKARRILAKYDQRRANP